MTETDTNTAAPTMAQRMMDAAICAYHIDGAGPFDPETPYWTPIGVDPGSSPTAFVESVEGINAGWVGTTTDGWVIVSLRGTLPPTDKTWHGFFASMDDWLQDARTKQVDFDFEGQHLGKAERGFLEATTSLWPGISGYLDDQVDWGAVQGVQIAGHSKGAAMTFLVAAMIRIHCPDAAALHVHSYAAPLAGDPEFADWYRSADLDGTTTRYQRADDIVPFLPPSVDWDVFDHLDDEIGFHIKRQAEYLALEAAGEFIDGGYQEVGSMVFYPGVTGTPEPPVFGNAAVAAARAAIIEAIDHGRFTEIPDAHSSACSYWPAIFETKSTDPLCTHPKS